MLLCGTGQEPGYCLTAADLSPRSPMTSFHDFFRPSGTVAFQRCFALCATYTQGHQPEEQQIIC